MGCSHLLHVAIPRARGFGWVASKPSAPFFTLPSAAEAALSNLIGIGDSPGENPLDLIEQIVAANEWPFDRYSEDEMNVGVEGAWTRYHMWFAWRQDNEALQFSCAYDLKVPENKVSAVYWLLALINEKMWLGHFEVWAHEGLLMFRHALLYRGGAGATPSQLEDLVEIALKECERFYPAVQFVIWGGKPPTEALAAAMLEPEGEA